MAKKEINEKTFELNLTAELLNISKSFLWYLDLSPFSANLPKKVWRNFINNHILLAEGLTQEEENDPARGGYDVSINYFNTKTKSEGRLMFLQFKAGYHKKYSLKKQSQFNSKNTTDGITEHVMFEFNDAAEGTQHSTLRRLANRIEIQAESVMYVFPRITSKLLLRAYSGTLLNHSSFVPILEIDRQAANQTPKIVINDGVVHKYRTSYSGMKSEINFFYFFFYYNHSIAANLLSELICIQIERLVTIILSSIKPNMKDLFIANVQDSVLKSINSLGFVYTFEGESFTDVITKEVTNYLSEINSNFDNLIIPKAPSNYTNIIPKTGFKLEFAENEDYAHINYQLF